MPLYKQVTAGDLLCCGIIRSVKLYRHFGESVGSIFKGQTVQVGPVGFTDPTVLYLPSPSCDSDSQHTLQPVYSLLRHHFLNSLISASTYILTYKPWRRRYGKLNLLLPFLLRPKLDSHRHPLYFKGFFNLLSVVYRLWRLYILRLRSCWKLRSYRPFWLNWCFQLQGTVWLGQLVPP
jgi:hypothetical protein